MDRIRIKGLELDCIVGVRPLEREREQRVRLDIAMDIDLSAAGRTGRIALTCDYTQIAEEVMAMLRFRRYHLIEMATEEIAAMMLGVHPDLLAVEITLDKPAALDGRARAASVEIRRDRSQYSPFPLSEADDQTLVLLETRDAGLYLFRVAPGAPLPPTVGRGRRELEWVQSGQLMSSGAMLGLHEPRVREGHLTAPVLMNRTTETAVLFRCVCPPLHRREAPVSLRPGPWT